MSVKKIIHKLHLMLGLTSGLVVFIVAVTGSIYTFREEIQSLTQSYRYVKDEGKEILPPSKIKSIADNSLKQKKAHAILYGSREQAANVIYYNNEKDNSYFYFVYINPYTGELLKVKNENTDFFRYVLNGHMYLWLPQELGKLVIGISTLIFVFMLISGIILWWPRNYNATKTKFRIKWNAGWRRKNYDLHSVLGFYICWLGLILAITGLVWSFDWFESGLYKIASGGKNFKEYSEPASDTTFKSTETIPAMDRIWMKMNQDHPNAVSIEIHPPHSSLAPIAVNSNPHSGTYWKRDFRYFDQHTLKELSVNHTWSRIDHASIADLLIRMNYDIHTGAILNFPGKILVFLSGILVASLPITGFLFWYGRKKKSKANVS